MKRDRTKKTFPHFPDLFIEDTIKKYNLGLLTEGYSDDYDDKLDPSIRVSFATAALRFGHTMVSGRVSKLYHG